MSLSKRSTTEDNGVPFDAPYIWYNSVTVLTNGIISGGISAISDWSELMSPAFIWASSWLWDIVGGDSGGVWVAVELEVVEAVEDEGKTDVGDGGVEDCSEEDCSELCCADEGVLVCVDVWELVGGDGEGEEPLLCELDDDELGEEDDGVLDDDCVELDDDGELLCELDCVDEEEELCEEVDAEDEDGVDEELLLCDGIVCSTCSGVVGWSPMPDWLMYIVWTEDCRSPSPTLMYRLGI